MLDRLSTIDPNDVFNAVAGSGGTIVGIIGGAASFVAAVVTVTTIMVMLLIEGPRAWQAILDALVGEERVWADRIGQNFLRAVGGYVRGNLTISFVAGIGSYIVMKILGVPYAETLAVMVAVLDVIPLVGATIGAVIVSIVGFATGGVVDGVVLVVYFVAYQQFENNLLQNVVYSKTVSLSPLIVFIAALDRGERRRDRRRAARDPAHLGRLGARPRPDRAADGRATRAAWRASLARRRSRRRPSRGTINRPLAAHPD